MKCEKSGKSIISTYTQRTDCNIKNMRFRNKNVLEIIKR